MMYEKLDPENGEQLTFLKREVRSFYDPPILSWQYLRRRDLYSGLYLLRENGKYIGSQGMIPINLFAEGEPRLTAKSESSFILPDSRGHGHFERLYAFSVNQCERDGTELIWGFTALGHIWQKKLHFDVYNQTIVETVLQMSPICALNALFKEQTSGKSFVKNLGGIVYRWMRKKRIPPTSTGKFTKVIDLAVDESKVSVQTVVAHWKLHHPDAIGIDFSDEFIQWRLHNNPILNYTFIGFYDKDTIFGFGVLNTSSPHVHLVEFMVDKPDSINDAMHLLLKYCHENGKISYLSYLSNVANAYSGAIRSVLTDLGAKTSVNNELSFVVKRTSHTAFACNDIRSFYINGMWTEGFRI